MKESKKMRENAMAKRSAELESDFNSLIQLHRKQPSEDFFEANGITDVENARLLYNAGETNATMIAVLQDRASKQVCDQKCADVNVVPGTGDIGDLEDNADAPGLQKECVTECLKRYSPSGSLAALEVNLMGNPRIGIFH